MIIAFIKVTVGMALGKVAGYFAKALALAFVVYIISSEGIKFQNHVIVVDTNNEAIQNTRSTATQGLDLVKGVFDSMEVAAKDTVAGVERLNQINWVMRKVESFGKYMKQKNDIFECTPYLSDLTRNSRVERKKFIADIDTMKVHYMDNMASYYKEIENRKRPPAAHRKNTAPEKAASSTW